MVSVLGSRETAEEAIWEAEEAERRAGDGEDSLPQEGGEGEPGLLWCSHPLGGLSSAYHDVMGGEPRWTTCHARYMGEEEGRYMGKVWAL